MYMTSQALLGVILKVIKTNQQFHLHIAQNLSFEKYEKICQIAFSDSSSSKCSSSLGTLLSLDLIWPD